MIGGHMALLGRKSSLSGWPLLVLASAKMTLAIFFGILTIQSCRSKQADETVRQSGDICVSFVIGEQSVFSSKSSYKHHWKPIVRHFFYDGIDHEVKDCSNIPSDVKPDETEGQLGF